MATFQAVYVRAPSAESLPVEAIAKHLKGVAEVRVRAPWIEFELLSLQDVSALGHAIAQATTADVVAVQIQTAASVFAISTFSSGRLNRTLAYSDGAWLQAEGLPQAWEAEVFFSTPKLQAALDISESDEEPEIRTLFGAHKIEQGAFHPAPGFLDFLPALGTDEPWWRSVRDAPVSLRINGQAGLFGKLRSLFGAAR